MHWLSEVCASQGVHVGHIGTDDQAGDIFTKAFTDPLKWETLTKLVGMYGINVFRSHPGSSSSGKAKALCLHDFRTEPVGATSMSKYTTSGKTAFAKDSTWLGPEQSDADNAWRRSPHDWAIPASAGYKKAYEGCPVVPGPTNEAITTEQDADLDMMRNLTKIPILEENKAKLMFHVNQMLRNLAYNNSTPPVRRMIEATPLVTVSMQILITLLEMTGRVPSLSRAMRKALTDAHGKPEPLQDIKSYNTGYLKIDIVGDSSLIFHVAENTPGASMSGKKGLKPAGWEFSVEGIHRLVKDYISMHCMIDMTAQGGATAAQFMKSINELWARSPVEMGADKFLLRVAVLCWTCNDATSKNKGKAGKYKGLAVTPEMRLAAEELRKVLEKYPVAIITGPGAPMQWNMDDAWGTGAEELLALLKPRHFHTWRSNALWSAIERCTDGWHGACHPVNEQIMARHLARAVDFAVSSHYLMRAFLAAGEDGDDLGEPNLEARITEDELLKQMESWKVSSSTTWSRQKKLWLR